MTRYRCVANSLDKTKAKPAKHRRNEVSCCTNSQSSELEYIMEDKLSMYAMTLHFHRSGVQTRQCERQVNERENCLTRLEQRLMRQNQKRSTQNIQNSTTAKELDMKNEAVSHGAKRAWLYLAFSCTCTSAHSH